METSNETGKPRQSWTSRLMSRGVDQPGRAENPRVGGSTPSQATTYESHREPTLNRARLGAVLLVVALASGTAWAAARVLLRNDWTREATGALPFGWAGAAGAPLMHTFCDQATGDRVYIVASRQVVAGRDVATVHAMSVVARGCADWPRN
jgi:hypothetical protein